MTTIYIPTSPYINVRDRGVTGDGSTADDAAIASTIAEVASKPTGGTVYFPEGVYNRSSAVIVGKDQHNVRILGDGPTRTVWRKTASTRMLDVGSRDQGWITNQQIKLANDVQQGAFAFSVMAGKGGYLSSGWFVLLSNAQMQSTKQAEFIHIHSVSGDSVSLSRPLKFPYTVADAAEVRRVNWLRGFEIDGIGFDGNGHIVGSNVNADNVLWMCWADKPVIRNCSAWQFPNWFIGPQGCMGGRIENVSATDLKSDGVLGAVGNYGYGIVELALNEGLQVDGMLADRTRHGYTTTYGFGLNYGVPMNTTVANSKAIACRGSGFDTHPDGIGQTFIGCTVDGSLAHGFQLRAEGGRIISGSVRDCIGAGMYVVNGAKDTYLNDLRIHRTNQGVWNNQNWVTRGALIDDGVETIVRGAKITSCPIHAETTSGNIYESIH